MPRTPLKALLRDLKAAGVVRYKDAKKGIELEFGSTMEIHEGEPLEGDDRRASLQAREPLNDPLRVAVTGEGLELDEEGPN